MKKNGPDPGYPDKVETRRDILDTVPGSILEVDENLIITLANREALRCWGSYISEGNTTIYDLFPIKDTPLEEGIVEMTLNTGAAQAVELTSFDGRVFKLKTNVVAGRHPPRVMIYLEDVTSRIELAKSFDIISREWHSTFDAISDPISLLDSDRKVLWCNRSMKDLIGKPFAAILGLGLCELIDHPDVADTQACIFNRMMSSRQREDGTFLLDDRWFKITLDPLYDENGTVIGAVHILNDITERRKAEEVAKKHHHQLLQADKMISLGILASGMAHEINNPNNSIMLNVSVLQKAWNSIIPVLEEFQKERGHLRVGGMTYEKMKKKMPSIFSGVLESSKKIQRIVNDLKYFSGKDVISLKSQVDMESVVKSAISLTSNMIHKSTRHFKAVYEKNLPNVMANFQNLEQVIINLIQNACQALDNPGNGIFITTTCDRKSREIVTNVKDEGIGIPEKDLKYIMEPFFTSKRSSGGTGLGLYMSSKIISDHGGTIQFFSRLGKGTTVEVRLPALVVG
jgi:PAS domain S-box-containing protein